jgi:hypothetical protein
LIRDESGQLLLIRDFKKLFGAGISDGSAGNNKKSNSKANKPKTSLKISEFKLTGKSRLNFTDRSVSPEFKGNLSEMQIAVSNINNMNVRDQSPVKVHFVINGYGNVDITGVTTLFSEKPTADLKGKIKNLDLGAISVYLKKAMTYQIESGQLDANIDFSSKNGVLDSKADLTLIEFYVDQLNEEESKNFKAKYGMLLPTALSLLREKNDSIHISFPITGDLTDPKFSFAGKITELSRDAIKLAVINYYTPFVIFSAAKTAFDIVTALRFPSITYQAGKSRLLDSHKKELTALIKLLTEKPYVKMSICGHATLTDRFVMFPDDDAQEMAEGYSPDESDAESQPNLDALLPKLVDSELDILNQLARKRQDSVKSYLTENGIKPERMIMCNPHYTNNDTGTPRVQFSL